MSSLDHPSIRCCSDDSGVIVLLLLLLLLLSIKDDEKMLFLCTLQINEQIYVTAHTLAVLITLGIYTQT